MTKAYYPQLTGFRFLAAIMVYFSHINPFEGSGVFIESFFFEMQAGVGLFFVLSGFLITLRYYKNLQFSKNWFAGFMVNRFARIYPVFFFLTVLTFCYKFVVHEPFTGFDIGINLLLLKAYSACHLNSGIMQAWSLTVEETFYLLSPFMFLVLKKHLKWRTLLSFQLLGFLVVGGMVVIHKKCFFLAPPFTQCLFDNWQSTLIYSFFGRCTDFLLGMALALVIQQQMQLPKWIGNMRFKTYVGLIGVLACICYAGAFRDNAAHRSGISLWHGIIENNLVLPGFTALLIWGLISESTPLGRFLALPLIEQLGKSSYVFYLIHIGVFRKILSPIIPYESVILLLLLIIAHLLYLFVEKKCNHAIRSWWFKPG